MPKNHKASSQKHRVVIIGGGFGGLYAAKNLGNASVDVTLIDRRNFHLFQPLLYQVATGGLSPGDIASPLRSVLNRYKNIRVVQAQVDRIDAGEKLVFAGEETYGYDSLVIATGSMHHYFGHDAWASVAPGLKTIEDALEIRRRIFEAYELAEHEIDPSLRQTLLTFVMIGGGPTGVELAGALAELAYATLKDDFRRFDPRETKIILIEAGKRILATYPERLAQKAQKSLEKLGVVIKTETLVTDIRENKLTAKSPNGTEEIHAGNVIWAAGVKATPLAAILAAEAGAETDKSGRIKVAPDLSIGRHPEIFVVGDLAYLEQAGKPLPGVAPVAMQQGKYAAKVIKQRLQGKSPRPFHYLNKGNLAVIGRNAAIADLGFLKLSALPAWLIWVFVHIAYLIEFDNRVLVLIQWAWNYFTKKRGARLITGKQEIPFSPFEKS